MEQSSSSETSSHSDSQEFTRLLWKYMIHCHVTRARHWCLSWATCIQSTTSDPISL